MVSSHVSANGLQIRFARCNLMYQTTFKHHNDAIGKSHEFVQVLADQQHGGSTVSSGHDLTVNFGNRSDIETKTRIRGNKHLDAGR